MFAPPPIVKRDTTDRDPDSFCSPRWSPSDRQPPPEEFPCSISVGSACYQQRVTAAFELVLEPEEELALLFNSSTAAEFNFEGAVAVYLGNLSIGSTAIGWSMLLVDSYIMRL